MDIKLAEAKLQFFNFIYILITLTLSPGLKQIICYADDLADGHAFDRSINPSIRQRSILNTLEEKQEAQENAISFLKNEISKLRGQQKEDHLRIKKLTSIFTDGTWATANLKNEQDQLRHDLNELKTIIFKQNSTLNNIEEFVEASQSLEVYTQTTIRDFEIRLSTIDGILEKDVLNKPANSIDKINRYENTISNNLIPENEFDENEITFDYDLSNHIPTYSTDKNNMYDTDRNSRKNDVYLSESEEINNKISDKIPVDLSEAHKDQKEVVNLTNLKEEITNLSKTVSKVEQMCKNLEENNVNYNWNQMQQYFINISNHLAELDKSILSQESSPSLEIRNDVINGWNSSIRNHDNRLKVVEAFIFGNSLDMHSNITKTYEHMKTINNSVNEIHKLQNDQSKEATNTLMLVKQNVLEMQVQVQQNSYRIARIDVQLLNSSLEQCQSENKEYQYKADIDKIKKLVKNVDTRTKNQEDKFSRVDRSMDILFSEVNDQGYRVKTLEAHADILFNITTNFSHIQEEVNDIVWALPRDCKDANYKPNQDTPTLIKPHRSPSAVRTLCLSKPDGIWTVIQQRQSGNINFVSTWDEYKYGFGDVSDEFWIGNEYLHYLTTQDNYQLRLDMWDMDDRYWYAQYNYFVIDDEDTKYELQIDGYIGNATDSFSYSNLMQFSTPDQDNDVSSTHCAKFYTSGWWYKHCHYGNLNGRYGIGVVWYNQILNEWMGLKKTMMRIRNIDDATFNVISNQLPDS